MKKLLKWLITYYVLGLILINIFTVSRFLNSSDILDIGPKIITQNMLNPNFYSWTLVWPAYLGFNLYNFSTGNW